MYTLKVTHEPEKRDFWQFIAVLDTARTEWKLARWGKRAPRTYRLDCQHPEEMKRILDLYGIKYIDTHKPEGASNGDLHRE